jgi:hypothetical protein
MATLSTTGVAPSISGKPVCGRASLLRTGNRQVAEAPHCNFTDRAAASTVPEPQQILGASRDTQSTTHLETWQAESVCKQTCMEMTWEHTSTARTHTVCTKL